ncbi:hypothetical protein HK100_012027 [Physocladia obscura]|uniref:Phytoene desaturase n=1 Tax=Physocladia obscura TaxID=109957 RepID=A0AAD5T107_9FUNG|nr:hypothetical protein HK100_012027 [Physocladia obscura]
MPSTDTTANTVSNTGKRVVVIGTGIGGVGIAARLSTLGYSVTVVEKNDFAGGRCSLIHKDGFRFDQGPSMLLMPFTFEEIYRDLDVKIEDYLDIKKCETNYKIHFSDNDSITLSSDMAAMNRELERIEKGSFKGFLNFMIEAKYNHDTSFSMMMKFPVTLELMPNFAFLNARWELFTLQNAIAGYKLKVLSSLWGRVSAHFKSDKLRKAFTFQSMYMGMSPYDAPGSYSLLSYSEVADGISYPIGGFNKVITTLETIAKSRGATFKYSCPVKTINIHAETKMSTGVTLESGETINADIVVCNQDLVTAYNTLLPSSPYAQTLRAKNQTCSTISFYWGLKRKLPADNFHGHNVFLAQDYKPSFDSIFQNHTLPNIPSFYIHVPSRIDPSCAPDGGETLVVLVPTGILIDGTSEETVEKLTNRARDFVIKTIQARIPGCMDFENWIASETINTPFTWEKKFGLWKGSALGLSHEIMQVIYMRPSMRHAEYGNCFFVGASTHPGTGVPVVLCGTKILENEIVQIDKLGKGFAHQKIFGVVGYEQGVTATILVAFLAILVAIVRVAVGPASISSFYI